MVGRAFPGPPFSFIFSAMAQTSPQTELLIEAAKLLYGERWSGALSQAIGVNQRTLQAIAEGRYELKRDHPMIGETLALLRERQGEIAKLFNRLQRKPALHARPAASLRPSPTPGR